MKILVVEDDLALSDVTSFTLRRAGFVVVTAHNGEAAITLWEKEEPSLVLLDLNLPKKDGMAVCKHIRQYGDTPIIILSVRNSDESVVEALELGADDYIVKPFSTTQLVARIRAVLRRTGKTATPGELEVAGLSLNRGRNEVQRNNEAPIRLTPLEVRLLEALMLNAGQVLPTDTLIDKVWGPEGGDRTMLKQLVYRLRTKLEPETTRSALIENVPGVGYTLAEQPA
ncbi:MAG TPA: response regulator transcription factor [Caldilineaceae bacterium]|nr:response regulator transcription factor [Caldilineaceae bacterium]